MEKYFEISSFIAAVAIAMSIDGFIVAVTYALRGMKISFYPQLVLSTISALSITISMLIGSHLTGVIELEQADVIGKLIICLIGVFILAQGIKDLRKQDRSEKLSVDDRENKGKNAFQVVMKSAGQPHIADLDRSGSISILEAALLGASLSFDSFFTGIGIGMSSGFLFPLTITVFILNLVIFRLGLFVGNKLSGVKQLKFLKPFAGLILIIFGLIQIL